ALVGAIVLQGRWTPQDANTAVDTFVALMLGVAVLLPWGRWPQAIAGLVSLLGMAVIYEHVPEARPSGSIALVVIMVVVSVGAADLLEQYRRRSFEGWWQQQQLVKLARDLAVRVDPDELMANVLAHGLRLVGAEGAAIALHVPERGIYRVEASANDQHAAATGPFVGFEVPADLPLVREIVERGTFALPDDDPHGPPAPILVPHGPAR